MLHDISTPTVRIDSQVAEQFSLPIPTTALTAYGGEFDSCESEFTVVQLAGCATADEHGLDRIDGPAGTLRYFGGRFVSNTEFEITEYLFTKDYRAERAEALVGPEFETTLYYLSPTDSDHADYQICPTLRETPV